jgi:hypothetical protein
MSSLFNFKAVAQGTVSGAVTGVAADLTIAAGASSVMLTNVGTQTVFFKFNTGGASATTDTPLLPNTQSVFSMPPGTTKISAIAAGAGSTLYATPGTGN